MVIDIATEQRRDTQPQNGPYVNNVNRFIINFNLKDKIADSDGPIHLSFYLAQIRHRGEKGRERNKLNWQRHLAYRSKDNGKNHHMI